MSGTSQQLCEARVAGAQGGYCRNEAKPGSRYCDVHYDRLPKIASEAMSALAKYLQTHDEQYLMDAYRLLHDEVRS